MPISISKTISPTALRAYDIRGEVGKQIFPEDAYYIARAFAAKIIRKTNKKNPKIALGYDGRISTPSLKAEALRGFVDSGVEVFDIGLGPSPMTYFAVRSMELDGGMVITASHNPKLDNGFKMMYNKMPLFGEEIQEIGRMCEVGDFESGSGKIQNLQIKEKYLDNLAGALECCHSEPKRSVGEESEIFRYAQDDRAFLSALKIAWDTGNGSAGEIVAELVKRIPAKHFLINEKIDGSFPAHHPDPTVAENLQQLIDLVKKEKCDLGLAFDGDGDRIGAVDGEGRIIWGDQMMIFFADDVLADIKGAKIIADVKASQAFFDKVKEFGGEAIVWKTGHSFIKQKLMETGAPLAGEMSGHIFFNDKNYGYDDAVYAAVRLINYFVKRKLKPSDAVSNLPKSYASPEYRIIVPEKDKVRIVEEIRAKVKSSGAEYSEIDGIRVMEKGGWWMVRSSNTQSVISIRAEGKTEKDLKILQDEIDDILSEYNLKLANSGGH